jgi:hypothetical protein
MRDDLEKRTIPLTAMQKGRLLLDCLPLVAFVVLAIVLFTLLRDLMGSRIPLFALFFAVIFLVLGYQALQRLRDLRAGSAIVERDVLENSHRASYRSSSRSRRIFFGRFARLGRMRLMPKAHFNTQPGQTYWVHYSPVSKIVWELEPADEVVQ